MTEDEKRELLKNDMKMAMEFGNVVDLHDMKQLYNLKLLLEKKPYFKTNLHMIYMRRIDEILANNSSNTCLKCKRPGTSDGFWCQDCMDSFFKEERTDAAAIANDITVVSSEKEHRESELPRLIALFLSLAGLIIIIICLLGQDKKDKLEIMEQPATYEKEAIEENNEQDVIDRVPVRINYISEEITLSTAEDATAFLLQMFQSDENQEATVEYIGECESDRINFLLPVGESLASGGEYAKEHPDETDLFEPTECWMFYVEVKTVTDEEDGTIIVDRNGYMLLEGTLGGNLEGITIRFR